ncbi:MAG: tetratricopeptide repeat protein, partial [Phycisphaeraceae bacterium JB051]
SSADAALLNQAQQAINNQQASSAIAPLTQLLQSHPGMGQLHRLLGHAYAMTGQTDLSRQHLIMAISHGQMTADALARLYQLDRADELHLANLGQLILLSTLEPNDKQYPVLLAQTYESLGNTQAAEQLYQSQLNSQPANGNLLIKLGQLAIQSDEVDQALVYLQTAGALGQTPASIEQTISRLYAQNKQYQQALIWHLKAWPDVDSAPDVEQIQRVILLKESGDLEAATTLANKMITQNKAADQALMILARIAMQTHDPKQARWCLQQLSAMGKAPARITAYLGALAFNEADYQQASHYLSRSNASEP